MPQVALTEAFLRSVKAEVQTEFWCSKTKGFGVRVGPNATTFIAKFKNQRHSLGKYPAVTLQDARRQALRLKADAEAIPSGKITFGQAYEKFKSGHIAHKKKSTVDSYKRVLELHFLPTLKNVALTKVTTQKVGDITEVLDGTPGEYRNTLAVARTFFRWCVRPPRRYISHSPLEGMQLPKPKKRKRILTDPELVKVWKGAIKQGYPHGTVVQLLMLLAQRRTETASLRWPWINERDRLITLPPEITKNNREHIVPYGEEVAAILAVIPRLNSTDLLFPSRVSDERPISGWSKFKKELDTLCTVNGYTLHDVRRTVRTGLSRLKVPTEHAERVLNHVSSRSELEDIYDQHAFLDEKRDALLKWEAHLRSLAR